MCKRMDPCFACTVIAHAENSSMAGEDRKLALLLENVFQDKVRKLSRRYGLNASERIESLITELADRNVLKADSGRYFQAFRYLKDRASGRDRPAHDAGAGMEAVRTARELTGLVAD